MLFHHNRIRTHPQEYVKPLKKKLEKFKGNLYTTETGCEEITNEGPRAVEEAINFLLAAQSGEPLRWSDGLAQAAKYHVNDIGPKGMTGHNSSNGNSMDERIESFGEWHCTISESCSFGTESGLEVILGLLVDDGVPNRGHRKNMFNPESKVCGIFSGPHKEYTMMTTIDYAGGFDSKDNKAPESKHKI